MTLDLTTYKNPYARLEEAVQNEPALSELPKVVKGVIISYCDPLKDSYDWLWNRVHPNGGIDGGLMSSNPDNTIENTFKFFACLIQGETENLKSLWSIRGGIAIFSGSKDDTMSFFIQGKNREENDKIKSIFNQNYKSFDTPSCSFSLKTTVTATQLQLVVKK